MASEKKQKPASEEMRALAHAVVQIGGMIQKDFIEIGRPDLADALLTGVQRFEPQGEALYARMQTEEQRLAEVEQMATRGYGLLQSLLDARLLADASLYLGSQSSPPDSIKEAWWQTCHDWVEDASAFLAQYKGRDDGK